MMLTGSNLNAARHYHTILTGDRQEMKRLLAKAQDCATDAISILNSITRNEAEKNIFINKIYNVLCEKGYGDKIRFKPEPKPEPTKSEREAAAFAAIKSMPFFDILERRGLVAQAAKTMVRA